MSGAWGPERWAIDLSLMLNAVLGTDRFPVDVPLLAKEYTAQKYPDDPVSLVIGRALPGFDGALFRAPSGKKGWGIFYNSSISSDGRVNFTLAHEFGHYLMHRVAYPDGIRCGEQDVVRWDSAYGQIEHQANVFSSNLLMPLDDFRRQIAARQKVDLDMISHCADRYRVSLIAAVLRWLQYTTQRAVLVVSRDGFILWSRASDRALKSGAFFRTSGPPVAIPAFSLAARQDMLVDGRAGVDLPAGVWFPEDVREMTIFAEQYDFAMTLLLLEDRDHFAPVASEAEEPDTNDRFVTRPQEPSSWHGVAAVRAMKTDDSARKGADVHYPALRRPALCSSGAARTATITPSTARRSLTRIFRSRRLRSISPVR